MIQTRYPLSNAVVSATGEVRAYTASNSASLINYGERYRSGARISSALVEATVNAVISPEATDATEQDRCASSAANPNATLYGSLRSTFRQWYPGLANENQEIDETARAA